MEHLAFAISSGLALILTNLDNMAVLVALLGPLGARRAVSGYVLAQMLVLTLSVVVAQSAGEMLSGYAGFLGLVPVALGGYSLFQVHVKRATGLETGRHGVADSTLAALLLFLTMSTDSFAVMVPLLADSSPGFRLVGILGAAVAIILMAVGAGGLARAARAGNWLHRAEYAGPYVMILAGLYVLWDSGTDML